MRNILKGKIEKEFINLPIKDFLKTKLLLSSRTIKRLAMDRQIFINRKSVKLDYKVKENDEYMINLDKDESQDIKAVKMDLKIIYEDDSMLIVDKPPFMVVHPTKSHQEDTLTNGILYYFKEKGENTIVRLVSRLDMNTSGLIIIAKNQYTHSYFSRIMQEDGVEKEYLGIVSGKYDHERGTIDAPIIKPVEENYRRIVREDGQRSITHYEVVKNIADKFTLVKFKLETGRTHQIRVHTTHLGHPLVDDELYGGEILSLNPRQLLHAFHLKFKDPMSDEIMEFYSELPDDFKSFIKKYSINHIDNYSIKNVIESLKEGEKNEKENN